MELTPNFSVTLYSFEDCIDLTYKLTQFNAGELHPQLQDYPLIGDLESITIRPITYGPTFMVELALLVNALRYEFHMSTPIDLDLPYVPYSRQDRACSKGEDFALKTFVSMLKSSGVDLLLTDDQHSNIDFDGFIYSTKQSQFVCKIKEDFDWFVAPDKGAFEKTKWNAIRVAEKEFLEASNGSRSMLRLPTAFAMQKVRTPTGITYDDDTSRSDVLYGDVLITDDICDGGATFLQCAEAIRKKHPRVKTISLYVTHGIFSKGVDKLKELFYSIYTANLMTSDEETNKFVKVI